MRWYAPCCTDGGPDYPERVTDPNRPEPGEYPPYGTPHPPPSHGQPQYGSYPPMPPNVPGHGLAPYGMDPVSGQPLSDKSKVAAGLLQLLLPFVGIPGVGRLYMGSVGIGLGQLLGAVASYVLLCAFIGFITLPALLLWSIIDGIVILAGNNVRDGQQRVMR